MLGYSAERLRLISFVDNNIFENILEQHELLLQHAIKRDVDNFLEILRLRLTKIDQEKFTFAQQYPDIFTGIELPEKNSNIWETDFLDSLQ